MFPVFVFLSEVHSLCSTSDAQTYRTQIVALCGRGNHSYLQERAPVRHEAAHRWGNHQPVPALLLCFRMLSATRMLHHIALAWVFFMSQSPRDLLWLWASMVKGVDRRCACAVAFWSLFTGPARHYSLLLVERWSGAVPGQDDDRVDMLQCFLVFLTWKDW